MIFIEYLIYCIGVNPPPPSGSASIRSMKAAKGESNMNKNVQPAPMNFFNPAAVQPSIQPQMNGNQFMFQISSSSYPSPLVL